MKTLVCTMLVTGLLVSGAHAQNPSASPNPLQQRQPTACDMTGAEYASIVWNQTVRMRELEQENLTMRKKLAELIAQKETVDKEKEKEKPK